MRSLVGNGDPERTLEFRILGPLSATRSGERLDLGPYKQRSLLALLLIHANQVVSTDRILDELWGDQAAGKQNALWVHVSQLRSTLEPDREPRSQGSVVLSRSPGYMLHVEPDQIDSNRFESMLTEARALGDRDPRSASIVLGEALALWRGRPLEDFVYEEFAQHEIIRLEELRVQAVEQRIDADLGSGRGPELVSELEALVREHPLRERLTEQLMLALYRSDRQADALRAYKALRSRLGETLGIEPSPSVQALEEQILLQEASLLPASDAVSGIGTGTTVRGYELREKIGAGDHGTVYQTYQRSVGREVAMKLIRPDLADDPGFIRRFETEARILAEMEHPHIVPLYDFWREPGAAYVVMRLMKGGNVAAMLERGRMSHEHIMNLVTQVAEALGAAHRHGVVHRNVKPSNILLDQDGDAYLTDFAVVAPVAEAPLSVGEPNVLLKHREDLEPSNESDIYGLGLVLKEALRKSEMASPKLMAVAEAATEDSLSEHYPDMESFLADLHNAAGTRIPVNRPDSQLENPYKGLRAFDESDAAVFFGRERLVERLVSRLGSPGGNGRCVVLVGPSGSGKSSVVKAGVIPALREGAVPNSDQWFVANMNPGSAPFEALETALRQVAVDPPSTLLEQLQADRHGLTRALETVLPETDSQLVLIVDQFEEIFSQTDEEPTRRLFLDSLWSALSTRPSRLRMVATLRADFYDQPLRYQNFGELLREATEPIPPMSPEELERAVIAPAEAAGAVLEQGLATAVVTDLTDEPSALPLMQYAMTEVFDRREGATLKVDTYEEIGGATGALGRRAEESFASLDGDAAETARQVFLRLVSIGEADGYARRRVLRSQLDSAGRSPHLVDRIVELYGRHRLLTFDRDAVSRGPTVEVAHEALLTEWDRCRHWIESAKEDLRFQQRLSALASEWKQSEENPGYLLTGPRLAEADEFAESTDLSLTPLQTRYVAESSRHAAEAHRARRRRRRLISWVVGTTAAVALAFLVFALTQRSAADRLAEIDGINRLIESAEDVATSDPELSLLLAAEAAERTSSLGLATFPENLEVLHTALRNDRQLFTVDGVKAAVLAPDGQVVYVTTPEGGIGVLDSTTGAELDTFPAEQMNSPGNAPLAISPDGRWLSNGYAVLDVETGDVTALSPQESHLSVANVDMTADLVATTHFVRGADAPDRQLPGRVVALWDRETGEELWSREVTAPIQVDISPDGTTLAITNSPLSQEYSVILFDVSSGEQTEVAMPDPTVPVIFHPTDDRLLLGGRIIRRWDIGSESFAIRSDGGHAGLISAMSTSRDGSVMVSGDLTGLAIIRDGDTGEPLFPLPTHGDAIVGADLDGEGTRLITRTEGVLDGAGTLRMFDITSKGGRGLATIQTTLPMASTIDADPSGKVIAVGDHRDGLRQVWSMSGEMLLELPPHAPFRQPVGINGPIAISPDGMKLVSGDAAGEIRLWSAEDGSLLAATTIDEMAPNLGETLADGGKEVVLNIEFSPDGDQIGIAGGGFVMVTDATTLGDARVLHESAVTYSERLAFSPDGTHLIAGAHLGAPPPDGFTNPLRVWDLATGAILNEFPAGFPGSSAVDYSPTEDLIAFASDTVTVVETDTWKSIHTLEPSREGIWDIAFSQAGTELAIAHDDGTISIWDPHSGEPLYTIPGHDSATTDLEWSDDGAQLFSVGHDGTIRAYAMTTSELIKLAEDRITRALTDQECLQYLGEEGCQ